MAARNIFITGATGFVGGDILHAVATAFPSARIRALVRDVKRAAKIPEKFSQVTLCEGDLDSNTIIKDEVRKADIVINAADYKHLPAVKSIAEGVRQTVGKKPVIWLQVSGASLLSVPDIKNNTFGEASDKSYDDLQDAAEIRDLIENTPSRAADRYVLQSAKELGSKVKTALVFGPMIYGQGRGLGNARSMQIPDLCRSAILKHTSVYVGKGEAAWGNVHIADVSQLFVSLIQAATTEKQGALWNEDGLYLVQSGEIVSKADAFISGRKMLTVVKTWKSVAEKVLDAAKQADVDTTIKSVNSDEADKLFPHGSVLYGTNSRGRGSRGSDLLGFRVSEHSLEEEIPLAFKKELDSTLNARL